MSVARVAVGEGRAHDTEQPDVETSGDGYAARFAGPVGGWLLEVQAERALALLGGSAAGALSVLDVGGGHGQLTAALRHAGHRVIVQGSHPACHRRLCERDDIGRVVSSLWALPFRDASFDLVLGIRLLAHVVAWRELLAEMSRVSRRMVLVDFPAKGALHALAPSLFGAKQRLEGNTRPYFDYTPREIEQAFAPLGLRPVGEARQFGLPMVLHRTLRSPGLSRGLEALAGGFGLTRRVGSPILLLAERTWSESGGPGVPGGRGG